ncbi:unnamed protein product [Ixodes persulcatus]
MTGHCDSNPAQYERNRRFGHLVHVLGRETSGAKLPSVGLRLNASKSESRLSSAMISCALAAFTGDVRVSRVDRGGPPRVPARRRHVDVGALVVRRGNGASDAPMHSFLV